MKAFMPRVIMAVLLAGTSAAAQQQTFQALSPGKAIVNDQVGWDVITTLTPTLTWTAVAAPVAGYHVIITEVRGAAGTPVYDKAGIAGTAFTVPAGVLRDSLIYVWYVTVQDKTKGSLTSTRRGFVITPTGPTAAPAAPVELSAALHLPDYIELGWRTVADSADGYEVWIKKTDAGSWALLEAVPAFGRALPKHAYMDRGRKDQGTVYYYRVRLKNNVGFSGYSNEVKIVTPGKAAAPPLATGLSEGYVLALGSQASTEITGGTLPYAVRSENPSIATAVLQQSGSRFGVSITAKAKGSVRIVISDGAGQQLMRTVVVR